MSKSSVNPEMSSLFMDFAKYFELSLALSEDLKRDVYKVRYNVYCEEFGYEDAERFKDQLETDAFDAQSIHCLVTHRSSGTPAGCVRLVTVDKGQAMPFQSHCGDGLDTDFFQARAERVSSMAEISRLAVDGQFRRRRGEQESRFGNTDSLHFAAREKRTFSLLAVSLFLASAAVADLLRRPNCFAIMEPFLPAILRRTGVTVSRVGEDFDYNGIRAPYYLNIDEAIRSAPSELRLCFEVVRAQFASELTPGDAKQASMPAKSNLGLGASSRFNHAMFPPPFFG